MEDLEAFHEFAELVGSLFFHGLCSVHIDLFCGFIIFVPESLHNLQKVYACFCKERCVCVSTSEELVFADPSFEEIEEAGEKNAGELDAPEGTIRLSYAESLRQVPQPAGADEHLPACGGYPDRRYAEPPHP